MAAPGINRNQNHDEDEISVIAEDYVHNEEKAKAQITRSRVVAPHTLLNRKTLSMFRRGVTYGELFQAHSFTWNDETGAPEKVTCTWRRALWLFNMTLTFSYSTFVAVRSLQTYWNESASNSKKIYMQFMFAYFAYPSALQMVGFCNQTEIPCMLRQTLKFASDFEEKYLVKGGNRKKLTLPNICYLAMAGFFVNLNIMSCLMTIASFVRPHSPEFVTSLVEDPKGLTFLQKMPGVLLVAYFEYLYHSQCFMLGYTILAFVFPNIIVLNELNPATSVVTTERLRNRLVDRIQVYQCIRLQLNLLNKVAGTFGIPFTKAILIVIVVFCVYGSIKMQGLQSIMLSITGFVCIFVLAIVFGFCAEFHSRSTAVLEAFQSEFQHLDAVRDAVQIKWAKRALRSLKTLKVTISSFYFVDRAMVLTMFDTLTEESVNFLLVNS